MGTLLEMRWDRPEWSRGDKGIPKIPRNVLGIIPRLFKGRGRMRSIIYTSQSKPRTERDICRSFFISSGIG